MKKVFLMIAAVMMTAMSVKAQSDEPKNELSVSYGIGISLIGDGIGNALGNGIFDQLTGHKWEDSNGFGTLGVEYFHHLSNSRVAFGGIATYSQFGENVVKKDGGEKVGDRTRSYISFMPAVKYYWVNSRNFGLYSKAAVGAMMMFDKCNDTAAKKSSNDNSLYFMYQASLLGLEAGSNNVRAFVEGGFGEQGILLAGLRVRF